jgi:hypothetical protein
MTSTQTAPATPTTTAAASADPLGADIIGLLRTLKLSGMRTLNTPPKNAQADSHPAITSVRVCEYVRCTNMCRDRTAVKISACTLRRRAVSVSVMKPI